MKGASAGGPWADGIVLFANFFEFSAADIFHYPQVQSRCLIYCRSGHGTIVLNNEINNIGYIMDAAYARGLRICFNPSPFAEGILQYPLQKVSLLIVNEIEGEALSGESDPEKSIKKLGSLYPSSEIVLTAGRRGSYCLCDGNMRYHDIIDYSDTVDTTAAGDTFLGYYLCSRMNGISPEGALHAATKASAITVTRQGAMESIPYAWELPED